MKIIALTIIALLGVTGCQTVPKDKLGQPVSYVRKGGGKDILDPRRVMDVLTLYPDARFNWWQEQGNGMVTIGMGDRKQPPIEGTYSVAGDTITIEYKIFPNTIRREFVKQSDGSVYYVHDGDYWQRAGRVYKGLP